jgi:hypothetical protein
MVLSCNESGVAASEFFPAGLSVAGGNSGLAYYRDLRSVILSPDHPLKVFTDDECYSMADAHGLDGFLLRCPDFVQARPLPIGCWPGPPPEKGTCYLGGAKAGDASLYLWGDQPWQGAPGEGLAWDTEQPTPQGRVWADTTYGKAHQVLRLDGSFKGDPLFCRVCGAMRLYWNFVSNGNYEEANDSLVMFIGDHFFVYNFPRDQMIEVATDFKPRSYRLESQLTISGKPVKGRYEVANLAVCTDGQYFYAGLRPVNHRDRAIYIVRAEPSQSSGAWPTALLRKIDGYYTGQNWNNPEWNDCIAVDDTMVVVVRQDRLYWWEKGQ